VYENGAFRKIFGAEGSKGEEAGGNCTRSLQTVLAKYVYY
jgi:hypothetical protein